MKIARALVTGLALSIPFAATACNKTNEKPKIEEVKPADINSKKEIDEKRKVIEKKEREFASELEALASCDLPNVLFHLNMVSENKEECLAARDIAKKLINRSEELIELTGNDFSIKKPNEEQSEAFNRLISMVQKGVACTWIYSTMKPEEISKKIKAEHIREYFTDYQQSLRKIRTHRDNLSKSIYDFNKKAKEINEPPYNPVWGLDLKKVENITIFVDVPLVEPNEIVKSKKVLATERKELKAKEVKLANGFIDWSTNLSGVLFYTTPFISPIEKRNETFGVICKLSDCSQDFNRELHSTPKEKVPNDELIELFLRRIKATDKATPFVEEYLKLSIEEFTDKVDKGYRNVFKDFKEEEAKDWVKKAVNGFVKYKKSIEDLKQEISSLIQSIEKFNQDTKLANELAYESRWGLSLERLESLNLKSIK
ncbi:MAG: hypothetical protein HY094_05950 [Candidatus Melainabacteria bacterium]|nr:hypothetical protein [Candidatus Melainabacteria bacterium]